MTEDEHHTKNYESLIELLAGDIAKLDGARCSVSSTAVALKPEIRHALNRGVTFRQIATAFAARGLRAEPDTIRIAVNRGVVTKAARARKNKVPASHQVGPPQGRAPPKAEVSSEVGHHRRGPNLAPRLK